MLILFLLICLGWPGVAAAQEPQYDNLAVVDVGGTLNDLVNTSLTLVTGKTKSKQTVVGWYFKQNDKEVRFYVNQKGWMGLKTLLAKAQAEWDTLEPRELTAMGSFSGHQVGIWQQSTLAVSLQGSTDLSTRRLLLTVSGGADRPVRLLYVLDRDGLARLSQEMERVTAFFQR